jgi:hypothetical protein
MYYPKTIKEAVIFGLAFGIAVVITRQLLSGLPSIVRKEGFVSKKCPDGTRSDGPCLMEFPGL